MARAPRRPSSSLRTTAGIARHDRWVEAMRDHARALARDGKDASPVAETLRHFIAEAEGKALECGFFASIVLQPWRDTLAELERTP